MWHHVLMYPSDVKQYIIIIIINVNLTIRNRGSPREVDFQLMRYPGSIDNNQYLLL